MLSHKFYKNKILSSSCPRGAYPGKRSTKGWIYSSIKRNMLHVQQAVENPETCPRWKLVREAYKLVREIKPLWNTEWKHKVENDVLPRQKDLQNTQEDRVRSGRWEVRE